MLKTISLTLGLLLLAPLLAWVFVSLLCKNLKNDDDEEEQ